jgi:hypothetical protein
MPVVTPPSNIPTTMLEFIGIMTIINLIAMRLERLFGGKQPKREIYIIRDAVLERRTHAANQHGCIKIPPQMTVLPCA